MTAPDLSNLSTGDLFARLAGQTVDHADDEDTPTGPEDVLDAWAQRLAGKMILAEAEASGWPLSRPDRLRAEALYANGTAYLEAEGLL